MFLTFSSLQLTIQINTAYSSNSNLPSTFPFLYKTNIFTHHLLISDVMFHDKTSPSRFTLQSVHIRAYPSVSNFHIFISIQSCFINCRNITVIHPNTIFQLQLFFSHTHFPYILPNNAQVHTVISAINIFVPPFSLTFSSTHSTFSPLCPLLTDPSLKKSYILQSLSNQPYLSVPSIYHTHS